MQASLFEPRDPVIFTRSTSARVDATMKAPSENNIVAFLLCCPIGMKLLELEDLNHFANSDFEASSDSDFDCGMDNDEDGCISEPSSSSEDSSDSDDNPREVVLAKAAQGGWGMAHGFYGKLYFTRDYMQGKFVPKNLKLLEPKSAPKPRAKASSKASSSGDDVPLSGSSRNYLPPPPRVHPPPPQGGNRHLAHEQ